MSEKFKFCRNYKTHTMSCNQKRVSTKDKQTADYFTPTKLPLTGKAIKQNELPILENWKPNRQT